MNNLGPDIVGNEAYSIIGYYNPSSGSFQTGSLGWRHCREQFHNHFKLNDQQRSFYWSCPYIKAQIAHIEALEDFLNLKCKYRTTFNIVRHNNVSVLKITPSEFWRKQKVRFYFFTIFLKSTASSRLKKPTCKQIVDLLIRSSYCKDTPRATALFLSGRTATELSYIRNWVDQFESSYKKKTKLCYPKNRKYFRNKNPKTSLSAKQKNQLAKWVMSREKIVQNNFIRDYNDDISYYSWFGSRQGKPQKIKPIKIRTFSFARTS